MQEKLWLKENLFDYLAGCKMFKCSQWRLYTVIIKGRNEVISTSLSLIKGLDSNPKNKIAFEKEHFISEVKLFDANLK